MSYMLETGKFSVGNLPVEPDVDLPNSEPPATFNYKVTARQKLNEFLIESTGTCNYDEASGKYGAQRKVWGLLRLRGVGEVGVLVRESLTLFPGTTVDGRDSRDPNNPNPDVEVQIGTASTDPYNSKTGIDIDKENVTVNGDVLVGYGGDPRIVLKDFDGEYEHADVKGYTGSLDEEPEFPPITPPDDLRVWDTTIEYQGWNPANPTGTWQITPLESGRYTSITLQQKATESGILEIVGGHVVLHITGDIWLRKGCEIVIKQIEGMPHASLDLYVSGNIRSDEGSGFNNQGTPPDLKLWGRPGPVEDPLSETPQDWVIRTKSAYFGQIYAPEATVQVNNSGDLYGAFTAYSFEMMAKGNLYYDGALRDVNPNDPGVRFVLKRWGEGAENPPYVAGL
jgi:hypothetical protein